MAKQKKEPNAQKTLLLQEEKGGLNIKEPEAHNLSMTLKHLLNLKQNEKQPSWMYIATYWLGRDIYNYSKDYHYLKNNNRVKTANQKTLFYVLHILCTNTKSKLTKTKK